MPIAMFPHRQGHQALYPVRMLSLPSEYVLSHLVSEYTRTNALTRMALSLMENLLALKPTYLVKQSSLHH